MRVTKHLIESFIKTAQSNNIRDLCAYLPRNHALVMTNKVTQIRDLKEFYAYGFDSLGNRVALCVDGYSRQFTGA